MSDCPNKFCDFRDVVVPNLEDKIREMKAEAIACFRAFDELKKNAEKLLADHIELKDVNNGLVATVVDLREALEEYGRHGEYCKHNTFIHNEKGRLVGGDCDCGLDAELKT